MLRRVIFSLAVCFFEVVVCGRVWATDDAAPTPAATQPVPEKRPAPKSLLPENEEDIVGAFRLVAISGKAEQSEMLLTGLPFSRALRLQSVTIPVEAWQQFTQAPVTGAMGAGDTGLFVFSIRAQSDAVAPVNASIKGSDEPYPVLATRDVMPTKEWRTVYVAFSALGGFAAGKANVAFFFGGTRQTVEIGGVTMLNFGQTISLASLKAVAVKLPMEPTTDGTVTETRPRFPFVIPRNEAAPNDLDVSFLNEAPAGKNGFIIAKGGHFYESDTNRHVRFFGTNIALEACFPSHGAADAVAAHLAKYGVNAVRLHHLDNTWDGPETMIWDSKYPDHRHLDPVKLERMDYLIAALEKRGIYIDMCLHVSRKFTAADGFPESVGKIAFFDKRVDEFDPQMIAVDQEYFHDLLTHTNPYTKLRYADDPGFLSVEINNEDSLMGLSGDTPGNHLAGLPEPYHGTLQKLWNAWLVQKYKSTEKLADAWRTPDRTTGGNLYSFSPEPSQWTLQTIGDKVSATMARDGEALRVNVAKTDDTFWHVQLYRERQGLLEKGKTYTLSFEAKSDTPYPLDVSGVTDHEPFTAIGISGEAPLSREWQLFSFTFRADNAEEGHNRLPSFPLGGQTGTIWIRNVQIKSGEGPAVLPVAHALEDGGVRVAPTGAGVARADWLSFIADTENAYNATMRGYLRGIGVKQMITLSQAGFGELSGMYREAKSDFVDAHSYWDYADSFYDPVKDVPMTPALGKSDGLTDGLAFWRVAGRPFTVTEYNIPFPNEYRAECVPEFASFAAFQDWDAIYLFAYPNYEPGDAPDAIQFPLDAGADPAIPCFFPTAAMMFRTGMIPMATGSMTLPLPGEFPAKRVAAGLRNRGAWEEQGITPALAFWQRLQAGLGATGSPVLSGTSGPAAKILSVQTQDAATARYVADAPPAKVVAGFVGGQTVRLQDAMFQFGKLTHNYGALTLCAMDYKPLAASSKALLTFVTHTQNSGQQWNAAHTMLEKPGTGPILVDRASVEVRLSVDGPREVYPLDASGKRGAPMAATFANGVLTFSIPQEAETVWFVVVKP